MKTNNLFIGLIISLVSYSSLAQMITAPVGQTISIANTIDVNGDIKVGTGNNVIKFGSNTILKNYNIDNTGVGIDALKLVTYGTSNVAIGNKAGSSLTTGSGNVLIGASSGESSTGIGNTFIGYSTGISASGSNNSFIGYAVGKNITTGSRNMFLGTASGFSNSTGDDNVFIGESAGYSLTLGNGNTMLGRASGNGISSGTNVTLLGYNSAANNGLSNATAVGANAAVVASNSLVLGNNANVGINTNAPLAKLHVVGGNSIATGVRFQNLPIDASGGLATQYVVIDSDGNLFRYTGTAPLRQGVAENSTAGIPNSFTENWTLKNDFLYNKNKKGIIIGEGIASLPKGYGMYVTDGILTEKVKVAIKNSSDWADYVFNKDYKKLSLSQVEKFITLNKHLPNMPSAAEMVAKGNDLAKTDAKLLEKIEELTLYMIEMKKENAQMKSQIKALKRKLK